MFYGFFYEIFSFYVSEYFYVKKYFSTLELKKYTQIMGSFSASHLNKIRIFHTNHKTQHIVPMF